MYQRTNVAKHIYALQFVLQLAMHIFAVIFFPIDERVDIRAFTTICSFSAIRVGEIVCLMPQNIICIYFFFPSLAGSERKLNTGKTSSND